MHTIPDHLPVPNRFAEKVAIVTGGGAGSSQAIVEELCKEGAKVLFTDISKDSAKAQQAYSDKGYTTALAQGDMADESFCKDVVAQAVGPSEMSTT